MYRRVALWLLAFMATGFLPAAWADENTLAPIRPQDHLIAIGPALRNLDYKGVFTYEQGGQRTSQQWVHAVRNGVEYERLLGLDGAHREILRERPQGCMQRSEKAIHTQLSASLTGDINALGAYYDFVLADNDMVAGRHANVILVQPKDAFRYGYRLFTDAETNLLLGADMIDSQGEVLEKFRFIQLHIGHVTESDLKPVTAAPIRMDTSQCDVPGKQQEALMSARWELDVPAGYTLCSQENRVRENQAEDVLMYSDGLSHFTVFIRHQPQVAQGSPIQQGGSMQQGNTLLRSETVELDGQLYAVTVVGEIPEATSQKIISRVKLLPAP